MRYKVIFSAYVTVEEAEDEEDAVEQAREKVFNCEADLFADDVEEEP